MATSSGIIFFFKIHFLDKILLRIRENLEYDLEFAEDQEKDWKSIMFWEDKCTCVRAKDSSEHLDDKPLKDVEVVFLKKTNYRLIQILKYFLESMSLQFQKHLIE
jgi:hypothetical protein